MLLTVVTAALVLTACSRAAPIPTTTFVPAPTVTSVPPTVAPAPTVVTVPSGVKPPTVAERAAFVAKLRAIDPSLVSDDGTLAINEGLGLCVKIAQGAVGQELALDAAVAFDASLGDSTQIGIAVQQILCPS